MPASPDNLIWIDLEMTGLDPSVDRIIEIATVVTDKGLDELAVGPVVAIYQRPFVLDAMDDWNTRQHTKSGLIARVKSSTTDEQQAERETLEFLRQHVTDNGSPMCGNSICQDRRFLAHYMPTLEKYFHYRNLDVSTLKELARRWCPDVAKGFVKESRHLALSDIRDSVEELKYYRRHLLRTAT